MRKEIEQAIALLSEKSPQSLEHALELIQGTVFSFSMKVCGQREDAEDTMQEVLVRSLPQLPKFETQYEVHEETTPWLAPNEVTEQVA